MDITAIELDPVHFGWAGGMERGQPRLLAEDGDAQRDVNHIHTVWRDPTDDFGDDILGYYRAQYHSPVRRTRHNRGGEAGSCTALTK